MADKPATPVETKKLKYEVLKGIKLNGTFYTPNKRGPVYVESGELPKRLIEAGFVKLVK